MSEPLSGEVPEWFKGTVLKTVVSAMVPRVRISPSPPYHYSPVSVNVNLRILFILGREARLLACLSVIHVLYFKI